MSSSAESTFAHASASAVALSITPVCTTTVRPSSRLISVIELMKAPKGTEPSGMHPPLMRHPWAPFAFNCAHSSNNCSGDLAGYIVSSTSLPQCLQLRAHSVPVMDIVGKNVEEE